MAKEMYYPNEGRTLIKNKIKKFEAGRVLIWWTYLSSLPVPGFISDNTRSCYISRACICSNMYFISLSCCSIILKKEKKLYDHGRLFKIYVKPLCFIMTEQIILSLSLSGLKSKEIGKKNSPKDTEFHSRYSTSILGNFTSNLGAEKSSLEIINKCAVMISTRLILTDFFSKF